MPYFFLVSFEAAVVIAGFGLPSAEVVDDRRSFLGASGGAHANADAPMPITTRARVRTFQGECMFTPQCIDDAGRVAALRFG